MAGFRILQINKRCKLEAQLNYLVVRGETETRILMDEISTLIIANIQCSLTAAVISQLVQHNVKIIFCDSQWDPESEVVGYRDHYAPLGQLMKQLNLNPNTIDSLWQLIIKAKLTRQARVLSRKGAIEASKVLLSYVDQVEPGDKTNREGLGAKYYFENLFTLGFNRRNSQDQKNTFLNYGYSIILSAVNREISASGYLLQLGIHHRGESNAFNFGCDLVEPLRPFVDDILVSQDIDMDNFKRIMVNVLNEEVEWGGKSCVMSNAIHFYVKSAISALENDDPTRCQFVCFKER